MHFQNSLDNQLKSKSKSGKNVEGGWDGFWSCSHLSSRVICHAMPTGSGDSDTDIHFNTDSETITSGACKNWRQFGIKLLSTTTTTTAAASTTTTVGWLAI